MGVWQGFLPTAAICAAKVSYIFHVANIRFCLLLTVPFLDNVLVWTKPVHSL